MASGDSCAVDPHQLLKALSTLLAPQGHIKSSEDVIKILNLMKSAKKLVSRCIYINILKATEDKDTLDKFVAEGGWELLNGWLTEAKSSDNVPVILELIKVFKHLPVTIDILKKNNTAKLIKQMSKGDTDEKLKEVANELVDTWLSVIRNHQPAAGESKDKPPIKKLKIKKIEKKTTDNGEEESSSKTSYKVTTKRTSSDSHSSDSKNERTKDDSENAKQIRRDSIDDNVPLSKLKKHLSSDKSKTGVDSKSKSPSGKTEEVKKRARTAKVPPSKFRSTGLEKEAPLPPIKIKKKAIVPPVSSANKSKPGEKLLLPVKREGPIFSKSLTPPDKKPKTVTSPTQLKAKSIPPKSKAHHVVQESSMFMSALNAPAPQIRKKRRASAAKPTSPTTNKEAKPEPPKFGFYAAIQQDDEKKEESEGTEKKEGETKTEEEVAVAEAEAETNGVKKKKSVRWKAESDLVEVRYFEMDATERVNVNKPKDFREIQQMEMMMERQNVKKVMKGGIGAMFNDDGVVEQQQTLEFLPWKRLIQTDLSMIQKVDFGCNSKEKDVQKHREMVVLAELYFSNNMVPETPKEPDPESYAPTEPKKIPLEDETAVDSTHSNPSFHPDVHHTPPHQQGFNNMGGGGGGLPLNLNNLDIPPDMLQILQQIPLEQGGGGPGLHGGPLPHTQGNDSSSNATITNVQNLLSSLMDNQGTSNQEDLTNRLREMLEPFKHQLPGLNMGQGPPNPGMPPPDGMGPPFGNPGDFGGPPPMMGGPGMPPGGGLLPPPFPDGPPQGMGPPFGGPGGPPFDGPGGPHFDPNFQGDPNFHGDPNFQGDPQFQGGPNFDFHGGPPPRGRGGRGGRGGMRGRGGRGGGNRPPCRHFMSQNGCRRGNACMFFHPGVHGPPLTTNGPVPLLPNPH